MWPIIKQIRLDLRSAYGPARYSKKFGALILDPSIRACVLIRMATLNNKTAYLLARNILISVHSIDVGRGLKVGAPLALPHPMGIVFGRGVTIGDHVVLYQGVTLGAKNAGYPVVENRTTIFPNAIVVGAITVGRGATIGAGKFVDKDVSPDSVVR